MHHDLTWWGFVLALAALVLMIPANILANVLTPKLKTWWAERSEASLRGKIVELQTELSEMEHHKSIADAEHHLLLGVETLIRLTSILLDLIAVTSLYLVMRLPVFDKKEHAVATALVYCVLGLSWFTGIRTVGRMRKFRRRHSLIVHYALRETIARLQRELAERFPRELQKT